MKRMGRSAAFALSLVTLLTAGCTSAGPGGSRPASPGTSGPAPASSGASAAAGPTGSLPVGRVPSPAHTVVVVMENHSFSEVIGNPAAPYLNQLSRQGALFTHSYAITHPSEPNYLALFSGSTHGVVDDSCPVEVTAPNLASGLIAAGKTFAGYSEDLPATGSQVCSADNYARKHAPWTDFSNVPGSVSLQFTSFPGADFSRLPTVSFVIPNLCNDMHSCSVATGDSWLRAHIGPYARWAMTHNSLLIITWDEDDGSASNQIPTIFAGQSVRPGSYADRITHYSVLATLEVAYGLPRVGNGTARTQPAITSIWRN